MKTFLLAATVAAGVLCTTNTADAQFRYRRSAPVYVVPAYGYATPSYYNSEQVHADAKAARNLVYAGSLLDYAGYLERWRETGTMPGALTQSNS